MKSFNKTTLGATALAAAVAMGVSQQASANIDVNPGVAAGVPYVSNNNLGQVLIFPYYTVRGGKKSVVNIFNTSDRTVAVKVRFHESHNSRDVLDFNLILSPFDKWAGTVSAGGNNGAIFKTSDNSCTIPAIPATGQALNDFAYNGSGGIGDVDTDQTRDRTKEGYIEVIAMGDAAPGGVGRSGGGVISSTNPALNNVAYNSTHVAGTPRNCAAVRNAFFPKGIDVLTSVTPAIAGTDNAFAIKPPGQMNVEGGSGSPIAASEFDGLGTDSFDLNGAAVVGGFVAANRNPLRGALTIIDETNGVGFGTAAVAIANFADSGLSLNDEHGFNTANLVTAQSLPYFLEPTIASRDNIWTTSGLADVEAAMTAKRVINEWANNPANGAGTDWVLQFPTKGFHVDVPYSATNGVVPATCWGDNVQAARNKWRGNLAAATTAAPGCLTTTNLGVNGGAAVTTKITPFTVRFGKSGSPIPFDAILVDKEERKGTSTGISFSPAQPSQGSSTPWESNIVTFGNPSVMASDTPEIALTPSTTIPGATNGSAYLSFTGNGATGLPVVGFVAKERNQGNASLSFGQIMGHSYQ